MWLLLNFSSAVAHCSYSSSRLDDVCRMRRERRLVTAVHGGGSSADNVTQMTALCLSVSFCFLICITPSMILLIGRPYWKTTHWYAIAKSITNQVRYIMRS